jgi:hypothetical protein
MRQANPPGGTDAMARAGVIGDRRASLTAMRDAEILLCDLKQKENQMRGAGRMVFAATLLLIAGTINVIYGIGALDDASIFVNDTRFILDNLNTLGWVLIILGAIQLTAGFSLMAGNTYGRVLGIVGGSLGAIGALFSIGGNNPWWSLAIFFLCVYVVHGIVVFGEEEREVVR